MFPHFALQALDKAIPDFLSNNFRRIVPASAGAALRFVPLQPLKEWDNALRYTRAVLALERLTASAAKTVRGKCRLFLRSNTIMRCSLARLRVMIW